MDRVRLSVVVLGILVLSGCQATQLAYNPHPMSVAYGNADLQSVAMEGERQSKHRVAPASVQDYAFFQKNSLAQRWLGKPKHKALAIGTPQACSRYYSSWGYANGYRAATVALNNCLKGVKGFADHKKITCGCRLVVVNQTVFMTPQELPFRTRLPAIALVKDKRGRQEILGYFDTTGRTGQAQALAFLNDKERAICRGTYTLGAQSELGVAKLSCFDGRIAGEARFNIAGHLEGQAYGTGLIDAGEDKMLLVYGLSSEEFEKRRTVLTQGFE